MNGRTRSVEHARPTHEIVRGTRRRIATKRLLDGVERTTACRRVAARGWLRACVARSPRARRPGAPGVRAALHGLFPAGLPRARAPRSAWAAGGADPPDLQRRLASTGARSALRSVAHLDGRLGKVATMLEDAEPDILAFYACHPTDESRLQSLRATDPTGHAIALMRALTSRCEIREALSISVIERRAGPLRLVDSAQCR